MSIQDIESGTGPRVRLAADKAGLTVAVFLTLPVDEQGLWFAEVEKDLLAPWPDPVDALPDELLTPTERAQAAPLEEVLAPYEQKRQDRRCGGTVA